jgi:cytochrome b subunit of formate dehydrogenase
VQGLVGAAVGVLIFLFWHRTLAYVVFSIAGLTMLLALLSPDGAYRRLNQWVARFAVFVGTVMTWITLVPLYFLFFTPFHLLFRTGRRDAMTRRLDHEASSYWNTRPGTRPAPDSYERQF